MAKRFIAFDAETPDYANDRISTIGITVIENGAVTVLFVLLIYSLLKRIC